MVVQQSIKGSTEQAESEPHYHYIVCVGHLKRGFGDARRSTACACLPMSIEPCIGCIKCMHG